MAPLEPRDHALKCRGVGAGSTESVAITDIDLLGPGPIEHQFAVLGPKVTPDHLRLKAAELGDAGEQCIEICASRSRPRSDRST